MAATATDLHTQTLLFGADRLTRFVAQHAVHGANVVAAHHQQALQLAPLSAGQARVIGWPGRTEGASAAQAVEY